MTDDNPWGWVRDVADVDHLQGQLDAANNAGPDGVNSGGILGRGAERMAQAQAPAGLSLPGQADSGAPDQAPLDYISRAEAGSPPALVDPTVLRYPGGDPVIDPNTGSPYPLPPGMDVSKNAKGGDMLNGLTANPDIGMPREITMASLFAAGMPEDYQRPNGLLAAIVDHDRNMDYRNVTNYNLGTFAARAGYSLEDTLQGAGFYNRHFGNPGNAAAKYGLKSDAVKNITQGWMDANRW